MDGTCAEITLRAFFYWLLNIRVLSNNRFERVLLGMFDVHFLVYY